MNADPSVELCAATEAFEEVAMESSGNFTGLRKKTAYGRLQTILSFIAKPTILKDELYFCFSLVRHMEGP